jgi:DNA-binding Lrp family transcriptional regulator
MKLTGRQSDAVAALLDMYDEGRRQPIAYARVAERLGVSTTTAYRMLRLAESLGYARATYAVRPEKTGAGRSQVLFEPTDLAHATVVGMAEGGQADEGWDLTRQRVLEVLASDDGDTAQAIELLVGGLDRPQTPVETAARMIAALMIGVESSAAEEQEHQLADLVARPATRFSLSTLSGMLLGLALADRATRSLAGRLERQLTKLQTALGDLSVDEAASITAFAAQLLVAMEARGRRPATRRTNS